MDLHHQATKRHQRNTTYSQSDNDGPDYIMASLFFGIGSNREIRSFFCYGGLQDKGDGKGDTIAAFSPKDLHDTHEAV